MERVTVRPGRRPIGINLMGEPSPTPSAPGGPWHENSIMTTIISIGGIRRARRIRRRIPMRPESFADVGAGRRKTKKKIKRECADELLLPPKTVVNLPRVLEFEPPPPLDPPFSPRRQSGFLRRLWSRFPVADRLLGRQGPSRALRDTTVGDSGAPYDPAATIRDQAPLRGRRPRWSAGWDSAGVINGGRPASTRPRPRRRLYVYTPAPAAHRCALDGQEDLIVGVRPLHIRASARLHPRTLKSPFPLNWGRGDPRNGGPRPNPESHRGDRGAFRLLRCPTTRDGSTGYLGGRRVPTPGIAVRKRMERQVRPQPARVRRDLTQIDTRRLGPPDTLIAPGPFQPRG